MDLVTISVPDEETRNATLWQVQLSTLDDSKRMKGIFQDRARTLFRKTQEIVDFNTWITSISMVGRTGVGKSTWINGFANYLYFDNLNAAVSSEEVVSVIPSKFTFTNDQGETKDVMIGTEGKNENFTAGQSATQAPVTYPFYVGEQRIQLIDTPGIGDSRGIEQDKRTFTTQLSVKC